MALIYKDIRDWWEQTVFLYKTGEWARRPLGGGGKTGFVPHLMGRFAAARSGREAWLVPQANESSHEYLFEDFVSEYISGSGLVLL